jgi:hypothetical protein
MLTSLAGPVVVGAAFFGERFGEWVMRRRNRRRFALILACTFPFLFVTLGTTFLDPAASHAPANYGAATNANFDMMKKEMGNPFSFPANVVFARRYGLPLRSFDEMSSGLIFIRSYKTAAPISGESIAFAAPPALGFALAEGFRQDADGVRMDHGRGRFVVTLYWPWVTHLRLDVAVHGGKPTTVHLEGRGFFLGKDLGSHVYALPGESIEWKLPPGGLSSGVNEVVVEADGPVTLKNLEFIDRTRHDLSLR